MRTKLFNAIRVSTLALILSFGLSFVYAWTAPTVTAPNGNVSAPINTSSTAQTKTGAFAVLGNLGIGTATPLSTLDVNGTSATTPFQIKGGGNVGVEVFRFYTADGTEKMRMRDNGNVGIGDPAPADKLSVAGSIGATGNITSLGTTTTNGLKVANGTAGANKVLTSDASGNASWQTPAAPAQGNQTFTTNGSFTVPASVTKLFVSGIGGGGGGGGGCGGNCALKASSAGLAGSSVDGKFISVTPGQIISITIGTGGAGGWGGAGWNGLGVTGGTGTPTVVGSLSLAGGAGGSYVGYTAACSGACGQSGANTIYGTGGVGSGGAGTAAQVNSGAGGAGGGADWSTGYYGGNGGSGKLIVYW